MRQFFGRISRLVWSVRANQLGGDQSGVLTIFSLLQNDSRRQFPAYYELALHKDISLIQH